MACVNAMEGMPEDIEGLHVLTVLKAAEEMAKENARFKDALKRIEDHTDFSFDDCAVGMAAIAEKALKGT